MTQSKEVFTTVPLCETFLQLSFTKNRMKLKIGKINLNSLISVILRNSVTALISLVTFRNFVSFNDS